MSVKTTEQSGTRCSELEQKQFETDQLLHLLMESNPFCIFWKDNDLVYRGCNQRFADMAGLKSPADVDGLTDFDMPWGIDNEIGAEACRSSDQEVIDTGREQMHIIEQIQQESGGVLWTDTSKVPIRDKAGKVVGVLCTLEDITERKLTEEALEEANKVLNALSRIDSLTQVANRRLFSETLEHEWRRAMRDKTNMAVILFDVDRFKKFNDDFGHLAGDRCLQQVAAAAKAVLKRPSDLIARYGGEEFVVLMPSVDRNGALKVAETMRQQIESLLVDYDDGQARVTCSFGVAEGTPAMGSKSTSLIAAADRALYRAKQAGRNCTMLEDGPLI